MYNINMNNHNKQFILQLQKGYFELVVLLILKKGDSYGYELTQKLNETKVFEAPSSSIYPVLNRLLKQKLIENYWKEKGNRMRKYYKITPKGERVLKEYYKQYQELHKAISYFNDGGDEA